MARLDALKGMVEQAPADSRVRFMLAMEYSNTHQFADAKRELIGDRHAESEMQEALDLLA